MPKEDRVLVAIINSRRDFAIARDEHWYRIPVDSAKRWVGNRWPPHWLAFYQTEPFGTEEFAINYLAKVISIDEVTRKDLFPNEGR